MRKRSLVAVVGCTVILALGCQLAVAVEQMGRFRFGAIFGAAMADHEDLNDITEDTESLWTGMVDNWSDEPVGGGPVVGAFAEYAITEQFALGAEFARFSGSGGYDWDVFDFDEYGSFYADSDVGYEVSGNVASVYGVYRMPLGDSPAALRFGAGVGYLFAADLTVDFTAVTVFEDWRGVAGREDSTYVLQMDLEASGSGMSYHGLFGVEYQITEQLLFLASATYRVAGVDELTVDQAIATMNGQPYEGLWVLEDGETLRWYYGEMGGYLSTEVGETVGLDFGGPQLTVGLAYTF